MPSYNFHIKQERVCQCGSCEKTFKEKELVGGSCPYCGSGNWVYGYIDDIDKY